MIIRHAAALSPTTSLVSAPAPVSTEESLEEKFGFKILDREAVKTLDGECEDKLDDIYE